MNEITITEHTPTGFFNYFFTNYQIARIIFFEELKTQKGKYKIVIDVDKYSNFEVLNKNYDWERVLVPIQIEQQIELLEKAEKIKGMFQELVY